METNPTSSPQKSDSIIHRVYELYLLFYKINEKLPKKDRYALGIKIERLIIELLESLFIAQSKNSSKLSILDESDVKLKLINLMVRLAHEVKAINQDEYILLEGKMLEIGRMIGGWIKYENAKRP